MIGGLGCLVVAGLGVLGQSRSPVAVPESISALQGSVLSIHGNWLEITTATAKGPPDRKQIDISSTIYESPQGAVVKPFPIQIGDRILVVVENRFCPPHKADSIPIRFRAVVIELLNRSSHGTPPGADKG